MLTASGITDGGVGGVRSKSFDKGWDYDWLRANAVRCDNSWYVHRWRNQRNLR